MVFKKGHPPYRYWLGKHFSKKHKKRLSEAKKGKPPWNKDLKGWNLGHSVSLKTREKISKALSGRKNPEHSKRMKNLWQFELKNEQQLLKRIRGFLNE